MTRGRRFLLPVFRFPELTRSLASVVPGLFVFADKAARSPAKKLQSGTVIPACCDSFPGISEINHGFDVVANQTAQRRTDSLYIFYEIAPI